MRTVFRQKMQLDARLFRQPGTHGVRGMATVIVHHHDDRLGRVDGQQMLQKGDEVFLAHPFAYQIAPLARANVQCTKDRTRSIRSGRWDAELLAHPLPHRPKHRQCLDARLIRREYHGVWPRRDDGVGNGPLLAGLLGIGLAWHGQPRASPAQRESVQGIPHGTATDDDLAGCQDEYQHGRRPKGRQIGRIDLVRILREHLQQGSFHVRRHLARAAPARVIIQPGGAGGVKLADPEAHRCTTDAKNGRNLGHTPVLCRHEDHLCPLADATNVLAGHAP